MFNRLRMTPKHVILERMLIKERDPMHMTVERVSYMHEDELLAFMEDIKHAFRPNQPDHAAQIQSAITAVRLDNVQSYTYDGANRIATASIMQDDHTYKVQVNFGLNKVSCSCGEPNWCRHRVTIIFHLYLQYHSLTDWIGEWRRMETEQMMHKIADRTPAAWNTTLYQLMNPIRVIGLNENPAVFIHKFSLLDQKAVALSPYEWEWKPVFDLYYRLHALDAAWHYLYYHLGNPENSFSYGKWYVKNWLAEQFNKIEDALHSLSSKRQLFELDPFYEELRKLVRTFMIEEKGLFIERFRLYRTFWQSLFTQKSMREKELALLEEINAPITQPLFAFFHIMDQQYDALEKATTTMTLDKVGAWFPLADVAEYEDDMEALAIIMQAISPFIRDYSTQYVARSERAMFARRIDGLLEMANFPETERERMFSYYGDAGVDVYADFLVERERYKEWAALMHRYRVPHEIAEAGGLKLALKEDPAAVLPLLHLYATKFIDERNRQSYRRAVNIFKKMKNGAKRSGKHEFFNEYIERIREKNRRLRALMEEIEKGNLTL